MPRRVPSFARRLQDLRKAAGLTQQELARRSGVSRQALSRLESGERQPTLDAVCQLAEALQVNVAAFAGNGAGAARNGVDGPPSCAAVVDLRQCQAWAIREAIAGLEQHAGREDFAVCTYPILKQVNDLLITLTGAPAEGNTREALRQVRNTLMNGGWSKYRDPAVRGAAADVLNGLAEADEVVPARVEEAFDRLYAAGLNPAGMQLLTVGPEDDTPDAEDEVPG
jgi:transcriptional regulator with XRE-family HTH domain